MRTPPIEWLEKAIAISSVTHQSNEEIVRFLIPLLKETGLKVHTQEVKENGQTFYNLIAYSHSLSSPNLLVLNTHLDTVSGGDHSAWTKTQGNPFKLTRVKNRLYGLGTADVKLDFLCKIWAARLAKPWKRPFAVVGTFGEERGLVGVTHLFKIKAFKPKYALVGEPSNLELIYAHKGHLIFSLSTELPTNPPKSKEFKKSWKGKSAHSSTPDLGDNAIRKGLTDIFKRGLGLVSIEGGTDSNRIPDLCTAILVDEKNRATQDLLALLTELDEVSKELKKLKDNRFNPASSQISLNQAITENRKLHLTFDIRLLPSMIPNKLRQRIEEISTKNRFKMTFWSVDSAMKGSKNGALINQASKSLKLCGVKAVKKTKASSTEAAIYQLHGAEAIVFGPGISVGNVHRPNEHNSLEQLSLATAFYTQMLRLPAGGTA
ncbi:M20/M25/M40 family metallo-hydrolase [bacterium]|nr:M20/M25/M40 family metallo-hydrolase [bacterium]